METKNCPICGASNSELAKFCYACGADLRVNNPTESAPAADAQANGAYQAPPPVSQPYQAPPQGNPYQQPPQNGYYQQTPPQGNPYQQPQNGYYQQTPPQGDPYQQPYVPYQIPYGYNQKSKIAAGILGILLGVFGVHNFYLGYTGKAVAQLLISLIGGIFTCGLATVAVEIWGLVEGIMILTGSIKVDGHNVPLSD